MRQIHLKLFVTLHSFLLNSLCLCTILYNFYSLKVQFLLIPLAIHSLRLIFIGNYCELLPLCHYVQKASHYIQNSHKFIAINVFFSNSWPLYSSTNANVRLMLQAHSHTCNINTSPNDSFGISLGTSAVFVANFMVAIIW